MKKIKLSVIVGLIGVYLVCAGVSYAAFNYLGQPGGAKVSPLSEEQQAEGLLVDNTGPKTEVCPLNGEKFTKAEKAVWETRRPLLVMIENHQDSRPQSGISSADVVYEAVAEGAITRFMAGFYCDAVDREVIVGPVRSARTYFLQWASEYSSNPLYVHVGGAHCEASTGEGCQNGAKADALGQIEKYSWGGRLGNDMNQFSIGFPTFWRDYERLGRTVATEHTMYSTTEKLWVLAKTRGWTNENQDEDGEWDDTFVPWEFEDEADLEDRGNLSEVFVGFWEGYPDYDVTWKYDRENNQFLRSNGGEAHVDLNTGGQLAVKNVVVQFMEESRANDGYQNNAHLLYDNIGSGKAVIFKNGEAIEATWEKDSRTDRTVYADTYGEEISFVPGKIWIQTVPVEAEVDY